MTKANQWTGVYMITASVMKGLTTASVYSINVFTDTRFLSTRYFYKQHFHKQHQTDIGKKLRKN